ncbi:MAG: threonine/serine exporter family protein [Bulleidia sp.]
MENNHDELARTVTTAGMILLENGAETNRVEDTMTRLCKAYGATVVDAYATPTLLMISFTLHDQLVHNIKRVHIQSTNLAKIDAVNTLSRKACAHQLTCAQLNQELQEVRKQAPYNDLVRMLGAAVCCFGFALFFQGTFMDAIAAFVIGILIQGTMNFLVELQISALFRNIIGGALLTACSFAASRVFGTGQNVVSISVLMLLVPGLAITNAIKDSVNGDLVSGLARGLESILTAIAIAVGSGFCLYLLEGLM